MGDGGATKSEDTPAFMHDKERRRSSASKVHVGDHLNLQANAVVGKMLNKFNDGKILFSDLLIKVNKRNKMQERILVITETTVYNIEPHSYKMKRRIPLKGIGQISISKLPDNFFIFHVPNEYDYLLVSCKKTEIITTITDARQKSKDPVAVVVNNVLEYRLDQDIVREVHFTRVDGGVSTQIYTKKGPRKQ